MAHGKIYRYPKTWTFKSEQIASKFDSHVRSSVPMYDELQDVIPQIARYFIRDNDCMIDFGCSTGTTISRIKDGLADRCNVKYIGIDDSMEMCRHFEKAHGKDSSILGNSIRDGSKYAGNHPISLITSLYTLQFIDYSKRWEELRSAYQMLRDGGALIIVEKIRPVSSELSEMYIDLYHDMKVANGLSPRENHDKSRSLRGVMNPTSLDDIIRKVRHAGFNTVDIFFQWLNFAGVIAVKQ